MPRLLGHSPWPSPGGSPPSSTRSTPLLRQGECRVRIDAEGPEGRYLRSLSRDRVGETSTARPEVDTRARARGFEVVEVFSDVDLSAYKEGVVRPAYEKMLASARSGELDAVVVWKVDRLARSLREFVRVTEMLDKYGVALVSMNELLDTSSPMGRAMMQIIGVFAELESATISLRTRNAKAHDAAHGRPNGGGRRPFGYTTQTFEELVPEEVDCSTRPLGVCGPVGRRSLWCGRIGAGGRQPA